MSHKYNFKRFVFQGLELNFPYNNKTDVSCGDSMFEDSIFISNFGPFNANVVIYFK
jgi:hypothetical protein